MEVSSKTAKFVATFVFFVQLCVSQTPPTAPAGSRGMCNDGTYSSSATKKGACRGHKGVKIWYATPDTKHSTPTQDSVPTSPPAPAPAGATGECNDGTYSTNATRRGACGGHKGIKQWFAGVPNAEPSLKSSASEASATGRAPASSPPAPTPAQMKDTQPAPVGGLVQVWLNTSTNFYHCSGSRYYGKTKAGAYMTEADAKAKGGRADHGKECSTQ
jgi:Protein of unknown function (DUF3761)